MRKIYKLLFIPMFFLIGINVAKAQCISPAQFGSTTASSTGTVNATTCAFAGEYSSITFTSTGNYYFIGTGGTGNFMTITDNLNNVIGFGYSPLAVTIPSLGIYRAHVSLNPACGTDVSCHTIAVGPASVCINSTQYQGATINSTPGFTTTLTTCAFASEFTIGTFTATGTYTAISTGGAGNYVTITNTLNNVIYAQGLSPVTFSVPANGVYRFHVNTSGPNACGTDASCHTVRVVAPGPPPSGPANDNCSTPQSITTSGTFTGTTILATTETVTVPTCVTSAPSQPGVWYTLTGNGNKLGVSLCSTSGWDSKVWVFTGSCGSFSCVTGNDDNGPLCSGAAASATWCSTPGTPYLILVAGFSSASNFTLTTTETVVTQPTVAINSPTLTICSGNSTTLTASGASSYTWNPGSSTASSIVITPSANVVYTLTGLNQCSSISTNSTLVTVNATPTVVVNSGSVCSGSSFTINPSGANTYTIEGGNAVVTPSTNTNYTVAGTSVAGCISSVVTSSVIVNALPVISVNSGTICAGDSFTINPSGAQTYTIEGGNAVVNPNSNTTYTVIGTDALGCVSQNPATSTVDVNASPVISVNSGAICQGQSFTISPSGANTYTIEGGNAVVTPSSNTSYTVIGTSSLGCVSQSAAVSNVTVNTNPTISANNGTICAGNSFTIIPSGASSYTVQGGNLVVNPTSNSSYTLIGESAEGCLSTNTATSVVVVNPLPVVSISGQSLVCQGQTAVLTASGADTYSWNTTATTASLMVAPSASSVYIVNGTNSSTGCSNTASFSITVDPCTGVSEVAKSNLQVSIYPNPNNGEFIVESANGINKTITVMDLTGKVLFSINSDSNKTPVNITEFDNGVYMIRVSSADNNQTFRLIKQ